MVSKGELHATARAMSNDSTSCKAANDTVESQTLTHG